MFAWASVPASSSWWSLPLQSRSFSASRRSTSSSVSASPRARRPWRALRQTRSCRPCASEPDGSLPRRGRTREPCRVSPGCSRASAPERALDANESARLYAVPVSQGGVRYGTVVAAVALDPYQQTARTALFGSLALALVVLGSVAVICRWMLGRALLPVPRMTESAEQWSERDLDQRFELG